MDNNLNDVNQALQEQIIRGKRAEDRFRALLESAPDAVMIVNGTGNIVLVNAQAAKLFGYSRAELLTSTLEKLIPNSFDAFANDHSYALNLRVELELEAIRKDASTFPVEITLKPIETEDEVLISGAIRDITQRKQVADALRMSEEQFRNTFQHASIGMALVDINGRWMEVNQAFCDIVGYPAAELLTKTFLDITHPDDLDNDLAYVRQLLGGEIDSYHMEKRYFHKLGYEVWVLLSVSLVNDAKGDPLHFIAQIQNITERKEAEDALKTKFIEELEFQDWLKALQEITIELTNIEDLETFYRRAVELGKAGLGFDRFGVLLLDPADQMVVGTYGTDAQGNVVDEHHIRMKPSELTGILARSFENEWRLVFDADAALFSDLRPLGRGWNAAAVLWNGVEKLGWLAIDNGTKHLPMRQTTLDILELYALTLGTLLAQKRTQIALTAQRNLLRTLINSLPDHIYIKDLNSHFLLVNDATARSLGATRPEDMIGKSDFDFHAPELAATFFEDEQNIFKYGTSMLNKEEEMIDAQGNKVELSTLKIPLRDAQGHMVALLGANRDITERKKAEQQAQELRREREQVKMLSDFIHNISHDFRTPLTIINSSLYFLERSADANRRKMHYQKAEQQVNHMSHLIDRLLLMSRLDGLKTLHLELLELNQAVTDFCVRLERKAGPKSIGITRAFSEKPLVVQADLQELTLALEELGSNALLYSSDHGAVTVRTRQDDRHMMVEIQDTGDGMADEDLPHIFERLYRADKARSIATGSSGLGLSIVKRIIELHDGTIEVESALGKGSTFRVCLPIPG